MELEYKEFNVKVSNVKQDGDKGTATILLSPYNNIDDGGDRVLPSCGVLNDKKKVPLLKQHTMGTEHGHLFLYSSQEGIKGDITLYLEKTAEGIPVFQEAYKHYALLKRAESDGVPVKYSIGYQTIDSSYTTVDKKPVRDLKSINIMEGSRVTFPMNPLAQNVPGSVKSQQIENKEGEKVLENQDKENKLEEKTMSFTDLLKVRQANDMRWRLQDALSDSFRQLMNDENMTAEEKVTQLNANVDDFAKAYKQTMATLLQASSKNKAAKKEIEQALETKSNESKLEAKEVKEPQETKAGKKISKANKDKLSQCKDVLGDLAAAIASVLEDGTPDDDSDDGTDDEDKSKKKPSTKPQPKEGEESPQDDGNDPNKQEKSNGSNLELKSEEISQLKEIENLYKVKENKGDEI